MIAPRANVYTGGWTVPSGERIWSGTMRGAVNSKPHVGHWTRSPEWSGNTTSSVSHAGFGHMNAHTRCAPV